jgi:hypothetical protein
MADASNEDLYRQYILIRDCLPVSHAVVAAAHASLAAWLRFQETPEAQAWVSGPFRKVICAVNDREFERAKACEDHVVLSESSLAGMETAIAFRPRREWPRRFRFFRLYRGPGAVIPNCS